MDTGFGAPVAHPFERWLLHRYALNVLRQTRGARRLRTGLARWLFDNAVLLGLNQKTLRKAKIEGDQRLIDAAAQKIFASELLKLRTAEQISAPAPSAFQKKLAWLSETLNFDAANAAIVGVLARAALSRPARELVVRITDATSDIWFDDETPVYAVAAMAGLSHARVSANVRAGAMLADFGLAQDRGSNEFALAPFLLDFLRHPTTSSRVWREMLVGKPQDASLKWEDFSHVAQAETAARLIAGALANKSAGVNILLYGEPGVGKSEFARAAAKHIKAQAIFVGEGMGENGRIEPSREARLGAVAFTGVLARQAGQAYMVVDEADDLFAGVDHAGPARRGSKAFVNRLVESAPVPTIWICNEPDFLGPAIVRRMNLAVRFRKGDRTRRAKMVEDLAHKACVRLDEPQQASLVALDLAPALVANAIRTAELTGGDGAQAVASARTLAEAMGADGGSKAPQPFAYDRAMVRAKTDLDAICAQAKASPERALSFCLHGPPGAGKTAFARHIAEELGLEIIERRASDLLSKWIGESEKLIRMAFEEAADYRAFLMLDEADSLLASRQNAVRSWEVSQVNELLVCMERHPQPFACTTNAFHNLDSAAMRRFMFKIEFLDLEPKQIDVAFQRAFGQNAPSEALALSNLTPGDFALVKRKADVMGETNPQRLTAWLREETEAKPARSRKIGF